MEAEIGNAAGVIWRYLAASGETTLTRLKHGAKLSDQLLLLGLGWLAREGKVSLVRDGRTVRLRLTEEPVA